MHKFPPIGMSPDVWGPIFWHTMHIVSLGYSDTPSKEEQEAATAFYTSLAHMIPCPICREHYSHFLREMPIQQSVGSRDALLNWVFTVHNKVNEKLGKSAVNFQTYVQNMRALSASGRTGISGMNYAAIAGLAAIVGIAGAAYYYYKK